MTKTYTEQWRDRTLSMGYYYVSRPTRYGGEAIKYLDDDCSFGLGEDIIQEVLGPVPDYMDCKGLIYASIALDESRKRIDELVSKTEQLKKNLEVSEKAHYKTLKQLSIATKALKEYADEENWDDIRSYNFSIDDTYFVEKEEFREKGYELAKKSLEEMEGVK